MYCSLLDAFVVTAVTNSQSVRIVERFLLHHAYNIGNDQNLLTGIKINVHCSNIFRFSYPYHVNSNLLSLLIVHSSEINIHCVLWLILRVLDSMEWKFHYKIFDLSTFKCFLFYL